MKTPHFVFVCLSAIVVILSLASRASAYTLQTVVVSNVEPSQTSCTPPPQTQTFSASDTVYPYFLVQGVNAGDVASLHWISPAGAWTWTITWGGVSGPGNWCFTGATLSVAQLSTAGPWRLEVYMNSTLLGQTSFTIGSSGTSSTGPITSSGPPILSSFLRSQFTAGEIDATLRGSNFKPGAVVSVDYFRGSQFQWNVAPAVGTQVDDPAQLRVHLSLPTPGEFRLTVKNPDQQQSQSKLIFVGLGGYKLPYGQGQSWKTTQGNNETCSNCDHSGKLAYAYDFANGQGQCVAAMKAGYAYTHDQNLGQTTYGSPGNYITIDHGNGEYSHYFHLQTGTFSVNNGSWVEQGQGLAIAGNSGYAYSNTPGDSGGYHVHAEVTKTLSPSGADTVPFLFDDVPSPEGSYPGQPVSPSYYTSGNLSALGGCRVNYVPGNAPSEADIAWNAIRARARSDSRFGSEVAGTQYLDPNWGKNDGNSGMRDLRSIVFNFSGVRTVTIFHAFYNNGTTNFGATIFYDPDRGAWASWVTVQP